MTTPPLNLRPVTPPGSPSASDFSYETSPALYLFTSLTAGSSHIITATSRLETILKANRVPFKAVDCATDEKARRIWSRRAGKKKLPGLVKQGIILADLELVEEWNEFGEIKENLGAGAPGPQASPSVSQAPAGVAAQSQTQTPSAGQNPASAIPAEAPSTAADAPAPPAQTPQQQQQSLLAREAAAIGAQRSKPKPIPAREPTAAVADTTTATTAAENLPRPQLSPPATAAGATASTPPLNSPPRSPELDRDYDIDNPKHNTSSTAALPPLSIRTNNASPTRSGISTTTAATADATVTRPRADTASSASLKSPDMPSAPPSSAVDTHTEAGAGRGSSIDAALARHGIIAEEDEEGANNDLEPSTTDETADDEDNNNNNDGDDDGEDEGAGTPHSPSPEEQVGDNAAIGGGADHGDGDGEDLSPRILRGDRNKHIAFVEMKDDDEPSPRILEGNPDKHISFGDVAKGAD